jgi:hypothetical protein
VLSAGGYVTNGSPTDTDASIFPGVLVNGPGTITNFGTISSDVYPAVDLVGPGTLTNFGLISGTGVELSAMDTLVAEPGSVFDGPVGGIADTLELVGGTGTITGLADGATTLTGAVSATIGGFPSIVIDAGSGWALEGANALASGDSLEVDGRIVNAGSFSVAGVLGGAGTLALISGEADFNAGSSLTIAKVAEGGGAATVATVNASDFVSRSVWTQVSGAVSVSAGDRLAFTGTGDSFEGTLTGAGTIVFASGSDTLEEAHLTAAEMIINGASVTLGGALDLSGTMNVASDDLIIAGSGASLAGDGSLILSNLATNKVSGGTLTNVNDYIKGAGDLGDGSMVLVNDKGGIIDGDDSVALTIDTGASTITNAGAIEATAKGTTTLVSAVDNTGVLGAFDGTLTVDGAVTGTGKAEIDGGTADFAGTFTQNVAFLGVGGGTLELAHSEDYTGEISGFSRTGTTALDLEDIAFVSGTTKASYSGTTTSGVLAVADGSHVAKITLEGNYTKSTFTLSSDGHGGTSIVDPAAASGAGRMASTHPFIAAMASLGASGGTAHEAADGWRGPMRPILAAPR